MSAQTLQSDEKQSHSASSPVFIFVMPIIPTNVRYCLASQWKKNCLENLHQKTVRQSFCPQIFLLANMAVLVTSGMLGPFNIIVSILLESIFIMYTFRCIPLPDPYCLLWTVPTSFFHKFSTDRWKVEDILPGKDWGFWLLCFFDWTWAAHVQRAKW